MSLLLTKDARKMYPIIMALGTLFVIAKSDFFGHVVMVSAVSHNSEIMMKRESEKHDRLRFT